MAKYLTDYWLRNIVAKQRGSQMMPEDMESFPVTGFGPYFCSRHNCFSQYWKGFYFAAWYMEYFGTERLPDVHSVAVLASDIHRWHFRQLQSMVFLKVLSVFCCLIRIRSLAQSISDRVSPAISQQRKPVYKARSPIALSRRPTSGLLSVNTAFIRETSS